MIAIIGILAVIVLIAINPLKHLNDAATARAQSDLREAAILIQSCITSEQTIGKDESVIYQVGNGTGGCGDINYLASQSYSKVWSSTMTISLNAVGGKQALCLAEKVTGTQYYYYSTTESSPNSSVPIDCPPAPYPYP